MTARKHWFRVADAVIYEGWTDNEMASFVRLSAHLNTRWAREGRDATDAGKTLLGPADVALITGARRRDVAEKRLERLAHVLKMSLERRGDFFEINWHKWPEFQGMRSDSGEVPGRECSPPHPHPHPPPQDAKKKRAKPSREAASPRESPDTPVADWAWLVPILGGKRLLAKSTEDELRMWLDVRYDEIAARIRSEVEPDKVWDGIKAHAISAWTMYLKTRDPTQRQFYREVATRQKSAALQALDAQLESQARASPPDANADEIDDDDPLRFMRRGANPHAN